MEKEAILDGIAASMQGYDFDASADLAAQECNCIVVYPESNQLQIDIDSRDELKNFNRRFEEFSKLWGSQGIGLKKKISKSKSGSGHYHIYISLYTNDLDEAMVFTEKPLVITETERILYQFALGSDRVRETLNTMRLISGVKAPTRLFEPKG